MHVTDVLILLRSDGLAFSANHFLHNVQIIAIIHAVPDGFHVSCRHVLDRVDPESGNAQVHQLIQIAGKLLLDLGFTRVEIR